MSDLVTQTMMSDLERNDEMLHTQKPTKSGHEPERKKSGLLLPVLLIIGDSDLVRPEHAVEMFRLLGGGVFGDTPAGLPNSQLAILPGTSHVTVVNRADLLVPMITSFLDAPMPEAE